MCTFNMECALLLPPVGTPIPSLHLGIVTRAPISSPQEFFASVSRMIETQIPYNPGHLFPLFYPLVRFLHGVRLPASRSFFHQIV